MSYLAIAFTVVFSYLFGSLNSAILVCKVLKHKDIRDYGSNNAGLTNVLRVFGKGPALATLIFDLIKGVLAVIICRLTVTELMGVTFFGDSKFIGYLAGFIVMIGHIFPVYYGFHGGKGVLLAATTLLTIDPLTCALSVGVFILMVAVTKYVSVGSIAAAVSYPIFTFIVQTFIIKFPQGAVADTILAAMIGTVIVYMHKPNIQRLIKGTENKFSFTKKNDKGDC